MCETPPSRECTPFGEEAVNMGKYSWLSTGIARRTHFSVECHLLVRQGQDADVENSFWLPPLV